MIKRAWWLILVLVLALAACGGSNDKNDSNNGGSTANGTENQAPATYTTLDVNAVYEGLQADDNAIIVDVREPDEWATTGVPVDATLISLGNFSTGAPDELSQDKTIYVICNSGNRSRTASQVLVDSGYSNVINVDGGIQAWLRAGLPVETYAP